MKQAELAGNTECVGSRGDGGDRVFTVEGVDGDPSGLPVDEQALLQGRRLLAEALEQAERRGRQILGNQKESSG